MPRRTIALSSTSRIRIIAMCTRDGAGRRERIAGSGGRGLGRRGGVPWRGVGLRCLGRHPGGEHAAVAGRRLDAQLAARELRALAHPGDAEVAAARELLELVGHLEAGAVVGDRQHGAAAEPAQPHRHSARAGVALDVAQRLAQDPLELALGHGMQLADLLDRQRHPHAARRAPGPRLRLKGGRQRQLLARVGAQPDDDLARLARRLAGVLGQLARLDRRRRRVALDVAREPERREAHAGDGLGQRVVHVARQPRALGLRGELGLGLGLAVEQAAQPRARRRDQRVQRRQHEARRPVVAHGDDPRVDADQHHREQPRAGPAVDEAAEQRAAERVVEERAVDARQQQDQRRQHELAREVARVAHERRPDAVPVAQRDERTSRPRRGSPPPAACGRRARPTARRP